MLTVRQIDLLYESIGSTRSKIHRSNVLFLVDKWSAANQGLLLLEGEGNTVQLFIESFKWLIQNLKSFK